ncbi:hypothetical protein BH23GEM8_BH23GEM8_19790 [soil metagenome]
MKENVGGADQLLRTVIGPALITLGLTRLGARSGSTAGLLALLGGALLLESAITRTCPVNAALQIDTR